MTYVKYLKLADRMVRVDQYCRTKIIADPEISRPGEIWIQELLGFLSLRDLDS